MADKYFVYRYADPLTGIPFYVGKGCGRRHRAHLFRKDHHPVTYKIRSLRAKGVEPVIDFICFGVDQELAALAEVEAVALYGRRDLGTGCLFNLTGGGDGCQAVSPETRAAMGRKISASKTGKPFTEAHKQALRTCKRKKVSKETCETLAAQMKRVWAERKEARIVR